jgi:ABC-type branched-subunit amino acid transport system permease subunit
LGFVFLAGIKFGALYALAALGLVVVHKATKTVNFAHGAFAMLGAFALIVVNWHWPYWAAYLLIPWAIGLIAAAMESAILRALRQADMLTVVIATVFGHRHLGGSSSDLQHRALGSALPVCGTSVHRRGGPHHEGYSRVIAGALAAVLAARMPRPTCRS